MSIHNVMRVSEALPVQRLRDEVVEVMARRDLDSGAIFLSRTREISDEYQLRAADRGDLHLMETTIPEVNIRQRDAPPGAFGL